ncbi:hypothetical protein DFH29DRAFT_996522 [Suillus ampliporus]|nr:hypothetical protein DFH29DRAFT_996522 [Suillus ampliporus]
MDGMDEYDCDANAVSLDSPPRASIRNKWQLPSSPSPPPTPSFAVLQKPHTSTYNNHSAFLSKTGSVRMSTKPSSASSSTPETSVSKGKCKVTNKKQIHSNICEQVDMLNDKIESITSGKMLERVLKELLVKTQYKLKNDRTMAKLDIYCEDKECQFIYNEHAIVHVNASVVHQCEQELQTMDIHLHNAESRAWDSEVVALHLRIKYKKLMQDEQTKGSDAAS